jgi:hypothetical protein
MKKWIRAVCVLAAMLMLTGCGTSFDPSVTSLYIQKNGKITQAIVESFEQDYYSVDEFKSMIEKEVAAYNQKFGEERITISRLELVDKTLYLLLDYKDADTYEQYNEEYCFTGTVSEALGAGLPFDLVFKDADYEEYTAAEATAQTGSHIVVLKEEGVVELERKVKYVSNNVEILDDHMVQVMPIEAEDEYAYIIFEK